MDEQYHHLVPTGGNMPSALYNNPELRPLGDQIGAVGPVAENAAVASPDKTTVFTPQGPSNDLMSLRNKFPFVAITPFPHESAAIVLIANSAVAGLFQGELQIPDGMVMGVFNSSGIVYMNRNGNAEIPLAANAAQNQFGASFLLRQNVHYYLGGVRSVGFAGVAASIVTVELYAPDQFPR